MNLKNIIIVLGIFISISLIVYADGEAKYSKLFARRLLQCLPYRGSYVLKDGTQISRRIYNWHEHQCKFHEEIKTADNTITYDCLLGRGELNEIVHAMYADPIGKTSADKIWEKYKQNKNYCTISN